MKKISYICGMENVRVRLITKSEQLPEMVCKSFFHSVDFFEIAERTPGYEPCMVVAEDAFGNVVAHLMGIVCRHRTLLPPWFYSHARIHGEGEYADGIDRETVFGLMLGAISKFFKRRHCLFTECSEMGTKMFGYKHFRHNGYFSIPWQEIHNSLHSVNPDKRLSKKIKTQLRMASKRGAITTMLNGEKDLHEFYKLLKKYFFMKSRRYVPNEKIFQLLAERGRSKTFATMYKGKIIGGCVCIYSDGNAYLWFLASKRKSYHHLSPAATTIWAAIKYAYIERYQHIYFLDAGLPFKRNPFREFILKFGGKPVAKFRWFHLPVPFINKFLSWIYNDR